MLSKYFFSRDLQFVMNCLTLKGTHNQFVMNCLTLKGTHKFQPVTERLDPNICLEFHKQNDITLYKNIFLYCINKSYHI